MPISGQQFDFIFNGNGYMLSRDTQAIKGNNGRAWLRRGTSDLPRRSFLFEEGRFGHQPDEIDHAELFEDFSGNFGRAYKSPEEPNAIMWSQNMDCLPGTTSVEVPSSLKTAARRWFEGELLEIATAGGYKLAATPNHPVLTDHGWTPLHAITKGQYVVCCLDTENVARGSPYVNHADTHVDEIFRLAAIRGAPQRIRGMNKQFHGDGQDGNVDVVAVNRELQDWIEAIYPQPLSKYGLPAAQFGQVALERLGLVDRPLRRVPVLADGLVHGGRSSDPLGLRHVPKSAQVILAHTTDLNASVYESSTDDPLVDSITVRERQLGLSIDVLADEVVSIVWRKFEGHVYNLETESNWYIANGIVTHNCRFPRQMVHCQQLQALPMAQYSGSNINCEYIIDDLPLVSGQPPGNGTVLAIGRGFVTSFTPTNITNTIASMFDVKREATSAQFSGRPALFGSFTYIPTGSGNMFQRGYDGITYTSPSVPAQSFINAGTRLWRTFTGPGGNQSYVRSVAIGSDPNVDANWSATLPVGNGIYTVNDMAERGDQVYLGMPDGMYVGDQAGSFFNIIPEARDLRHADNGRDLDVYDGGVVYAGQPGTFWFQASNFGGQRGDAFEVGARGIYSNRSPVRGRPRVNTSYGPWLYQGLWTGSESYILAGRREGDRQHPYTWRVMHKLPSTAKIDRIHFDGITNASGRYTEIPTRMWVATEASFGAQANATSPMYVCAIPRLNENPIADTAFSANYVGSARCDLPYADWQMPGVQKIYRAVEIWADMLLSGAQYCDVWATIDNGARTYVGRAQTSPKSVVPFPGENGTFLTGQAIQLSLESFTASFNVTPLYRSVIIRGAVRPNAIDVVSAVVRIADNMRDRRGQQMRDAATMISELRTLSRANTPAPLEDLTGAFNWCILLPSVEEQEVYQAGEDFPEVAATIRMAVLNFTNSTGSAIGARFVFPPVGGAPMR